VVAKLPIVVHPGYEQLAAGLASALGAPLVQHVEQITTEHYLEYGDSGLSLVSSLSDAGGGKPVTVCCDFVNGTLRHRRLYGGGIRQALGRAVGISSGFKPLVADLTAGLGRDGYVLASLGARVILVERNEVVAALLADGLARLRQHAAQDNSLREISDRLTLHRVDGKNWLRTLDKESYADVIYLDPMFPERSKSARVKKDMAIFHGLVGDDADAGDLLELACKAARYRVVVKRPRRAPPLAGIKPRFSIAGKTTRFDIHVLKKIPR